MGTPGTMGAMGLAGMNGESVVVTTLAMGSTQCPAGGALLTSGDGGTAVVCNGTVARESVYGSGSAGPLTISANTDWSTSLPASLEFTDVTIASGVTLTVPSGVTIRATGTFTNLGTIEVQPWGGGGSVSYIDEPLPDGGAGPLIKLSAVEPGRGIAAQAARNGVVTRRTQSNNSAGGQPLSAMAARQVLRITEQGGGAGGSACVDGQCYGGSGGGAFSIRARGAVQAGAIRANGGFGYQECSGGGAGGVIVIASGASITVGAISAQGAGGTANGSGANCSGGGAGGGGLVHLIAPQVGATTTVDVSGGQGGSLYGTMLGQVSATAGGGGACAGAGGPGGGLNGQLDYGGFGMNGLVISTQANPTTLY